MTREDVYEEWKQQRSAIEVPDGFESEVMSKLVSSETNMQITSRPSASGLLDRPAWAGVAVVAASIAGIMRVTFALLIGIL